MLFGNDLRYRRFLALHPGIWNEVGALDDKPFLRILRAERRRLGLSADCWCRRTPARRSQLECSR